jgi:ABC-2 type transport system permease protein
MRGTLIIFRRELFSLATSSFAWILLTVALFLNGILFTAYVQLFDGDVTGALRFALGESLAFWAILVFLPPLLTMRMVAEEARSGLVEFLLTSPISDAAVILGKFLAATTFLALFWCSVPLYGLVISGLGASPDWGPLLGGTLGAILTSGLFVSTGLLASTSTATPVLAAFLALAFNLAWLALPLVTDLALGGTLAWITNLFSGADGVAQAGAWLERLVGTIDILAHFQKSFLIGLLDTTEVVFFLTWTGLFLFLSVRLLETRRWR